MYAPNDVENNKTVVLGLSELLNFEVIRKMAKRNPRIDIMINSALKKTVNGRAYRLIFVSSPADMALKIRETGSTASPECSNKLRAVLIIRITACPKSVIPNARHMVPRQVFPFSPITTAASASLICKNIDKLTF
jgi:hypothetical protein